MEYREKLVRKTIFGTLLAAGLLNFFGHQFYGLDLTKRFPLDKKIEDGFARPSNIEILLGDLNGNHENETILKYNNKSCFLRLNEKGELFLSPVGEFIQKTDYRQKGGIQNER